METHARDGAPKEPVDKRWPLAEVVFNGPTKIAGISMMVTSLEAGTTRLVDGKEWAPPPMWFDPVTRFVVIDGCNYPVERVHYFKRAKMAITKKPPGLNLDKYTIGKRTVL